MGLWHQSRRQLLMDLEVQKLKCLIHLPQVDLLDLADRMGQSDLLDLSVPEDRKDQMHRHRCQCRLDLECPVDPERRLDLALPLHPQDPERLLDRLGLRGRLGLRDL
jgi:hypothetical protein